MKKRSPSNLPDDYRRWLSARLCILGSPRSVTDLPASLWLVAAVFVASLAVGCSLLMAQTQFLAREADFHARVCDAKGTVVEGRPFVYWPDAGQLDMPTCVEACPSAEDVVNSRSPQYLPSVLTAPQLLQGGGGVVVLMQQTKQVEYPAYETALCAHRFCLPPPGALLRVSETEVRYSEDALLGPLHDRTGGVLAQLRRLFGDVYRDAQMQVALYAVLASFLGGGFCLLSLYVMGQLFLYLSLAVCALTAGACATLLWEASLNARDDDACISTVADMQGPLCAAAGTILVGATCILLLTAMPCCRTARRAVEAATTTVALLCSEAQLRKLWLLPPLLAACQLLGLCFWLCMLPFAASVARVRWPLQETHASDAVGNLTLDSGALLGISDFEMFGLQKVVEHADAWFVALMAIMFLSARMWILFAHTLVRFVAVLIVSQWYFRAEHSPAGLGACPVWDGLVTTLRYHLGSLAAQAFRHSLLPLPVGLAQATMVSAIAVAQPWLVANSSKTLPEDGYVLPREDGSDAELDEGFADGVSRSRVFFVCTGTAALVDVVLRGEPRPVSVATAASLSASALPAIQSLLGSTVLLGLPTSLPVILAAAIGSGAFLASRTACVPVALLFALLAHISASSWSQAVEAACDAMLLCVAVDDAARRSLQRGDGVELEMYHESMSTLKTSPALWSSELMHPILRGLLRNVDAQLFGTDAAAS